MTARICYLGDDHLGGAAAYLAGVMGHYGLAFDHVDSTRPPPDGFTSPPYALYVISDYPRGRFRAGQMEAIVDSVRRGAGLAMFGGWESFHGRLGEYGDSPIAEVLPVDLLPADDRRNCAQPCLVRPTGAHPITDGLPWERPPGIGGYNAIVPQTGSEVILVGVPFEVQQRAGRFEFTPGEEFPLLVTGSYGRGRTVALATDVAPHWVGGWVDWGPRRVVQAVGEGFVEVGNLYAEFFRNLLRWAMQG